MLVGHCIPSTRASSPKPIHRHETSHTRSVIESAFCCCFIVVLWLLVRCNQSCVFPKLYTWCFAAAQGAGSQRRASGMDRESFTNRRACDTDRSAIERAVKRPRRAQTVTFCPSIQLPLIAPGISLHPDCAYDWPPPLPCAEATGTSMSPKLLPISLSYSLDVSCYFGTFCYHWALALRCVGVDFVL